MYPCQQGYDFPLLAVAPAALSSFSKQEYDFDVGVCTSCAFFFYWMNYQYHEPLPTRASVSSIGACTSCAFFFHEIMSSAPTRPEGVYGMDYRLEFTLGGVYSRRSASLPAFLPIAAGLAPVTCSLSPLRALGMVGVIERFA